MRRIERGWHLYLRKNVYWISYPFDGKTVRASTRTRDPVEAEATLRRRHAEVEGTRVDLATPQPRLFTSEVPEGDPSYVYLPPKEWVDLANALLVAANSSDVSGVIQNGIRLAARIRRKHRVHATGTPPIEVQPDPCT